MNAMKGKMDQLLEAMMALARKEDIPHVVADASNIASKLGSSSLQKLEVVDHEFGLSQGYISQECVVVPLRVRISMVNLDAQDHFVALARHISQYNEKYLRYAYFMPT